jgi:hypothetical protein
MFELLIDDLTPLTVVIALESGGQRGTQLQHETLHRIAQRHSATGGQFQAVRTPRIGEIIDVAPIGRRRFVGGATFEKLLHERAFAAATRPKGEYVETRPADGDAEFDRFDRSFLPNETGQRRYLVCRRET